MFSDNRNKAFPSARPAAPAQPLEAQWLSLQVASKTGLRPRNEDATMALKEGAYALFLVADGLGGHAAGDFASALALKVFEEAFWARRYQPDARAFLHTTALEANRQLLDAGLADPALRNTGTTLSGGLLTPEGLYVINIGDSRTYLFSAKRGTLLQLSRDHSVVQDLVEFRGLSPAAARNHPDRNLITSCLGMEPERLRLDVEGPLRIDQGDRLLACTDGVHDVLLDEYIRQVFLEIGPKGPLAERLVNDALAMGSQDNVSVAVLAYA